MDINRLKEEVNKGGNIIITMHQRPDGDAMGSTLALYNFFKTKEINSTIISPTEFPENFNSLAGAKDVVVFPHQKDLSKELIENADFLFCLDFNDLKRISPIDELINQMEPTTILIDHHLEPQSFDYEMSDTSASSTCELVFDFINQWDGNDNGINLDIARCLYTGLLTDTGSFQNANTTVKCFEMAAVLLNKGVLVSEIQDTIFSNYRPDRLHFLGNALLNRLQVYQDIHIALIGVRRSDVEKYNLQDGDTEGLVNYPLSIKGINISVLLKEHMNKIKLSFRSKGDISVNKFARKYFRGGGHKNAAGGIYFGSYKNAVKEIITKLKIHFYENN